jgi:hypothetical protein
MREQSDKIITILALTIQIPSFHSQENCCKGVKFHRFASTFGVKNQLAGIKGIILANAFSRSIAPGRGRKLECATV